MHKIEALTANLTAIVRVISFVRRPSHAKKTLSRALLLNADPRPLFRSLERMSRTYALVLSIRALPHEQ